MVAPVPMPRLRTTALLAVLLALGACGHGASGGSHSAGGGDGTRPPPSHHGDPTPPPMPTGTIVLSPPGRDPVSIHVEVANDDASRQRGLMFRRQMDADAGMIFLFDASEHLSFWMHNTYLPLDMVFITHDKRVLGVVENAEPLTDDPREVEGESQYVLELNAGVARQNGIGPGTPVQFVGIDEHAAPRGGGSE